MKYQNFLDLAAKMKHRSISSVWSSEMKTTFITLTVETKTNILFLLHFFPSFYSFKG